jgi:Tfp pilus assembly pilus retraction ATPase PilT
VAALLQAVMPTYNAVQFEKLHDTDFAYEIPGVARFRANVFMDRFGMGAVFRQIPVEIVTAEKLGLSREVMDLCFLSKGLELVTGPTGSGKEPISIAIETAETGRLVFGTLHTTTAASTVDRIIEQFPGERQPQIRTMPASSLKGVISQTLCKKIGGGRVAAMETLFVNSAVSNLIREGKIYQIPSIMQTGRKQGMTTLNDVLFKLVTDKMVAPEEAWIKAIDKPAFAALLKSKSIQAKLSGLEE